MQDYSELSFGSNEFPREVSGSAGIVVIEVGVNGFLGSILQSVEYRPPLPPPEVITSNPTPENHQTSSGGNNSNPSTGNNVEVVLINRNNDRTISNVLDVQFDNGLTSESGQGNGEVLEGQANDICLAFESTEILSVGAVAPEECQEENSSTSN